jgi:hypothetical protein
MAVADVDNFFRFGLESFRTHTWESNLCSGDDTAMSMDGGRFVARFANCLYFFAFESEWDEMNGW